MVLTLIGYRGTGKTSVAGPLAERLGWEAVDADRVIEGVAQASIREIFETQGEPAFRRWERQVMETLLKQDRTVIAAGGGAVLDADTQREMQAAGPVVWLTASVETLVRRLAGDEATASQRPNLTGAGGRAEIETLLRRRAPLYRACADLIVDTDGRDVSGIVEEIVAAIGPRLGEGAAG